MMANSSFRVVSYCRSAVAKERSLLVAVSETELLRVQSQMHQYLKCTDPCRSVRPGRVPRVVSISGFQKRVDTFHPIGMVCPSEVNGLVVRLYQRSR